MVGTVSEKNRSGERAWRSCWRPARAPACARRLPKVLHAVGGRPLIAHVLGGGDEGGPRRHRRGGWARPRCGRARGARACAEGADFRADASGAARRMRCSPRARRIAAAPDDVLVMFGDTPLVRPQTLREAARGAWRDGAAVAVLGFPAGRSARLRPADHARRRTRRYPRRTRRDARGTAQITLCNGGLMALARQTRAHDSRPHRQQQRARANSISPTRLPSPARWA